jgi:hypothetical protein
VKAILDYEIPITVLKIHSTYDVMFDILGNIFIKPANSYRAQKNLEMK